MSNSGEHVPLQGKEGIASRKRHMISAGFVTFPLDKRSVDSWLFIRVFLTPFCFCEIIPNK